MYEWQASTLGKFQQFAPNVYDALLVPNGTARATISFNTDGSVSYYRDGVWLFTHKANNLFKNGANADVAGRTV
ncbi:MAG: hypothetical protein K2J30_05080, partial [Clostridia bacterium]|nr:hypothetical protein [Clostridia bacterium]